MSETTTDTTREREFRDAPTLSPDILDPDGAAIYLGLPVSTVRAALRRGEIRGALIARRWRIRRTDLDALFTRTAPRPAPAAAAPSPTSACPSPVVVGTVSRGTGRRGRPRRRA